MNLEQLKAGIHNKRAVTLHGATLTMRILSDDELLQCRADAIAHAGKIGLDEEGMHVDLVLRQLFLSLTDSEGKRLAGNIVEFRRNLTRQERKYLVDEYLAFEAECSPDLDDMTEDQFDEILEEVKKSPDSILSPSSTDLLRRLARFLERRGAS